MTSSALSNFLLSLPANLALVTDNAKSASQPAAPTAAVKPVKASRWGEGQTKAQAGKHLDYQRRLPVKASRWGETKASASASSVRPPTRAC
jgi:hypothetical protein